MQGGGDQSEGNQIMTNSTSGWNTHAAPTTLDALKYACLNGIDSLDFVLDRLGDADDVEERGSESGAFYNLLTKLSDQLHEALQSQVPHRLALPFAPGGEPMVHSNTYDDARFYSDGTPVYVDADCTIPSQDEDGVTYLSQGYRRDFGPLPGGAAA